MSAMYYIASRKGSVESDLRLFFKKNPNATSCEIEHYKEDGILIFSLAYRVGFHKEYYSNAPARKRLSLGIWRITPKPHILKQLRNNEI